MRKINFGYRDLIFFIENKFIFISFSIKKGLSKNKNEIYISNKKITFLIMFFLISTEEQRFRQFAIFQHSPETFSTKKYKNNLNNYKEK